MLVKKPTRRRMPRTDKTTSNRTSEDAGNTKSGNKVLAKVFVDNQIQKQGRDTRSRFMVISDKEETNQFLEETIN